MIIDYVPFYRREVETPSPLGETETWLTLELYLAYNYDDGRLAVWNAVGGVEIPIHLLNDVETGEMLKRLPAFLKYVRERVKNLERRRKNERRNSMGNTS
jgi:hypothetical protein